MSFKENKTNINRNGRPKGSQNKEKVFLKTFIEELINDNRETIINDFKKLTSKDRLMFVSVILKYVLPIQKENTEVQSELKPIEFVIRREVINSIEKN